MPFRFVGIQNVFEVEVTAKLPRRAGDRVSGEAVFGDETLEVGGSSVVAEHDEVAGADSDIVGRLVTELQRGTEEVVLVHLDEAFAVRLRDDVGNLRRRERRGHFIARLDPKESDDALGDGLHDGDERAQQSGEGKQRGHEDEGRALRRGDRQVLWDHLADHNVQVDDDQEREREREGTGQRGRNPEMFHRTLEGVVQGALRNCAKEHRAHRDAQLGTGEQGTHLSARLEANCRPSAARGRERFQLAAPCGHGRELGTDEEGVQEQQAHGEPRGGAHDVPPPESPGVSPSASSCGTMRNRSTRRPSMSATMITQPGTAT